MASWQEITSFLLHNFSAKTKIFQKGRDDVFDSLLIHRLSQKCVALKNQFSTLILIFIISFLTFSALLLTLLFSRWLSQMILLDNYAVIPPLKIFRGLAGISAGTLFFFLISYICRTFFLTFLEQKNDLLILALLGTTKLQILISYALHPLYYLIFVLPLAAFLANKLIQQFIHDFFSEVPGLMHIDSYMQDVFLPLTGSLLFICCCVFLILFRKLNRLIKKGT